MTKSTQAAQGLPEDFQIDISIQAGSWPEERDLRALCSRAFDTAFTVAGLEAVDGSEVSLVFTNDEAIRELNHRWREKDKATNVLSFPGSDPDNEVYGPLLGDIVLACETVQREAAELGIEFSAHVTHLVVHGMLHLFDYDHQEDDEAELMESLERLILAELGIADPYAEKPLTADDD
ncbi:rRNA maturation RNase YbeY [Roseibium litorale]|uniref:Endoribonuclease YbeY n=1 Tax=Roseibium litorale TaxID=2803841 RepID=A0ABR9CM06_9HYPH|nr:rRNA maturation RNase YbeY [Roseibium litorale]MBD8891877.1 rRNA maturation RNase YbeY [Roseibium litorale]